MKYYLPAETGRRGGKDSIMSKKGIRICAVVLVLLMCLSLLPMAAWADGEGGEGGDHVCDPSTFSYHAPQAATCTEQGTIEFWKCDACSRCYFDAEGTQYISSPSQLVAPVDPNAHAWGEWTTVTAATCVDKGSEKRVCTLCNAEETREVEATGVHNYVGGVCTVCQAADPDYTPALTGTATIAGGTTPGSTLTVTVNASVEGPYAYEWILDGTASTGVTGASYVIRTEDVGKTVTCVVSSSAATGTLTSNAVTVTAPTPETHWVVANYSATAGTVSFSTAGMGGVLSSGEPAPIGHGKTVTLVITAKSGYVLKEVKLNGTSLGAQAQPSATVDRDLTFTITFEQQTTPTYTATVSAPTDKGNGVYTYSVTVRDASGNPVHDTGDPVTFKLAYPKGMTKDSHVYSLKHEGTAVPIQLKADGIYASFNLFSDYDLSTAPAKLSGKVTISGSKTVGSTLTATVTEDNNTGDLQYQWMRDGSVISGATGSSYNTVKADSGKNLTVQVTSNMQTGALNSAAVKIGSDVTKVHKVKALPYPSNRGAVYLGLVRDENDNIVTTKLPMDANGFYLVPDGWDVQFIPAPSYNYRTARIVNGYNETVDSVYYGPIKYLFVTDVTEDQYYTVIFQYMGCSPRTGDEANFPLWTELGLSSLLLLGAALIVMKKKKVF